MPNGNGPMNGTDGWHPLHQQEIFGLPLQQVLDSG
jgi:hypothetical protein